MGCEVARQALRGTGAAEYGALRHTAIYINKLIAATVANGYKKGAPGGTNTRLTLPIFYQLAIVLVIDRCVRQPCTLTTRMQKETRIKRHSYFWIATCIRDSL